MSTEPLPHLETFVVAAERGSFTAAARHLGLTQAAVSLRVQHLEAALRTKLFRRFAEGVMLTTAGHRLHDFARRILALTAEARAAVTGITETVAGELVLAASSVPGQHLLPPLLAAFRQGQPHVGLRMAVSDTEQVLRQVEQGEVDLGITGAQGAASQLEFRRFARDELAAVVPTGHSWCRKRHVTVRDLLAQPLIQREEGSGTRRCMERALERFGVAPSRLIIALELGSPEAVKNAVLEGAGVAILSRRSVEKEVSTGQLKAVPVKGLALNRDFYVVRNKQWPLSRLAELFLAFVNPESEVSG